MSIGGVGLGIRQESLCFPSIQYPISFPLAWRLLKVLRVKEERKKLVSAHKISEKAQSETSKRVRISVRRPPSSGRGIEPPPSPFSIRKISCCCCCPPLPTNFESSSRCSPSPRQIELLPVSLVSLLSLWA